MQSLTSLTGSALLGNRVSDLTPVAALTNLTDLYLNNNLIADISPLGALTNLSYVPLENNYLDVSAGSPAMTTIALLQSRGTVVNYLPQNTLPSPIVSFADPNLEAAVRSQLVPPIPAIQPVTEADMLTLTTLDASNRGITTWVVWSTRRI